MVGNLTVGKEKYKDNWEAMDKVRAESEALRAEFVKLMNEDTESFNVFMAAMKMPKATDEEKAARRARHGGSLEDRDGRSASYPRSLRQSG